MHWKRVCKSSENRLATFYIKEEEEENGAKAKAGQPQPHTDCNTGENIRLLAPNSKLPHVPLITQLTLQRKHHGSIEQSTWPVGAILDRRS